MCSVKIAAEIEMFDREVISAEIKRVLPKAEAYLQYEQSLTARPSGPRPDAADAMISLASVLDAQPGFSPDKLRFYETLGGSAVFHTIDAWRHLCEIATKESVDAALNWLHKIITTKSARLNVISEVFSIKVPNGGLVADDIRLLPYNEVIDTPLTAWMKSVYTSPPGSAVPRYAPHVLAIVTVPNAPIPTVAELTPDYTPGHYRYIVERVSDLATALTGVGPGAPVVGRSWSEFEDDDLNRAVLHSRSFKVGNRDDLGFGETQVDADAIGFARRLLAFEGDFRRKLLIASSRLALARRRKPLGDKAIEGSICLEALLGDDRFDYTYKLGLRAALLIESTIEGRKRVRSTVQRFYRIRGSFVHGSRLQAQSDDAEVVRDGLEVCASVLRRMVELGPISDWPRVELSGGDVLASGVNSPRMASGDGEK